MQSYKIRKSEYSNLEKLLSRIDAIREVNNRMYSYPQFTFANSKTLKIFERELMKVAKKERNFLSHKYIKSVVAFHMFQYSPVLNNSIKDGYVIVDDTALTLRYKQDIEGE